jgi:hypothetical protein
MSTKLLTAHTETPGGVIGWESAASEAERLAAISHDETRKKRLKLSAVWFRKMHKIGERFPGSAVSED